MFTFIIWTIKTVIYSAVFLLLCSIAFVPAYWASAITYVHFSQNLLIWGGAGFITWLCSLGIMCGLLGIK